MTGRPEEEVQYRWIYCHPFNLSERYRRCVNRSAPYSPQLQTIWCSGTTFSVSAARIRVTPAASKAPPPSPSGSKGRAVVGSGGEGAVLLSGFSCMILPCPPNPHSLSVEFKRYQVGNFWRGNASLACVGKLRDLIAKKHRSVLCGEFAPIRPRRAGRHGIAPSQCPSQRRGTGLAWSADLLAPLSAARVRCKRRLNAMWHRRRHSVLGYRRF